ncbi:MAG: B-box zinc finger protein [Acidimicrobiales bacterium]
MRRSREERESTEVVCARHRTPTQLRCVRCQRPICPRCLVQTPVGFMCDKHKGPPVKRAEDLPLTSKFRPLGRRQSSQPSMSPMIGLLMFPLFMFLSPVLIGLTGGSLIGVFLVPLIPLVIIYALMRRRRR